MQWSRSLIRRVLPETLAYTVVAEEEFVFGCNCNKTPVLSTHDAFAARRQEILEREVLELSCGFCGKNYRVMPERLRALKKWCRSEG